MLQLEAPAYVKYGDQIHLKCDFDLGGKTLYRYRQYSIVQYSTGAVQYSTGAEERMDGGTRCGEVVLLNTRF